MPRIPPLSDKRTLPPAETALALELLGNLDLLRLKTIARLYARGLPPDVAWDDLLQEALTRMLTGARKPPEGVPRVAFVAGIMRSLKAEHWRRVLKRYGHAPESDALALADPTPGPERVLIARQQLEAIGQLFAGDRAALQILAGLAEGLPPERIRERHGISKTDYDSARKRMRRALLREGLTWEPS